MASYKYEKQYLIDALEQWKVDRMARYVEEVKAYPTRLKTWNKAVEVAVKAWIKANEVEFANRGGFYTSKDGKIGFHIQGYSWEPVAPRVDLSGLDPAFLTNDWYTKPQEPQEPNFSEIDNQIRLLQASTDKTIRVSDRSSFDWMVYL